MKREFGWWPEVIAALALIALVGGWLAFNDWIYGDWRCALAQCRLEK